MQPLAGVRVLDFSTLLPGPLATLLLAEAGAEVIKIERPGRGDEMRSYVPKFGTDSVNFALLNRGKRSIAIDLKAPDAVETTEAAHRKRGRRRRAVSSGRHGPAGPRLRGAARRSIRASSIARSPATASTARAPTSPRTTSTTSPNPACSSLTARRGRRAGAAGGAGRRHRRRHVSGGDQHPARAARA